MSEPCRERGAGGSVVVPRDCSEVYLGGAGVIVLLRSKRGLTSLRSEIWYLDARKQHDGNM